MIAIEEWNAWLDAKLEKADSDVTKARKWLDDRKREEESNAQEQKIYFEQKLHQTKLEMHTELTASQASQHTPQALASGDIHAKLLKLVITKFDGTFMDWPRFWGQFSETIDKTSVAAITKFSYLRFSTPKLERQWRRYPSHLRAVIAQKASYKKSSARNPRSLKRIHERFWTFPPYQTAIPRR